jgi:hypothetical protein
MVRTTTLRLVPAALCGVGLALTLAAPVGADPDPPKGPPVDVPVDPSAGRPADPPGDRPGEPPIDLPVVPPADAPADVPADVPADRPGQAGGGDDSADRPADPPGNNGTVKIDDTPFDDHPDNEPHVSCSFQVDFYGFDQGDLSATVTFEAVPPTVPDGADRPGRVELLTDELAIGEDAAGGGTDLDASGTYDLTDALAGIEPHPQQGWHVKLTVHAEGSQGADTKHKVFWVSGCDTPPTPTTPTSTPGPSTSTPGGGHTPPSSGPPTSTSPSPSTSAVASNGDDGGGGLPLTGSNTLPLVLGGAALVAVGTAGVVAARKYRLAATSSVE